MFKFMDRAGLSAYYKTGVPNDDNSNINIICVDFGLNFMAKSGYPIKTNNPIWGKLIRLAYQLSVAVITLGVVLAIIDSSLKLKLVIMLFQTIGTVSQSISRMIILTFYKPILVKLAQDISQFWRIEELSYTEKIKYLKFYFWQSRVFQSYIMSSSCVVILICSKAFFGSLPMYHWIPKERPTIFWCASVNGFFCLLLTIYLIIGFDMTFVAICNNVTNQLKLIQKRFDGLNYKSEDVDETFNALIEHHSFLLRYTMDIQKAYTTFFLIQYAVSALSGCAYVVAISLIEDFGILNFVEAIMYMASITLQFSLFCVPLTEITTEARNIGDAVFHSEWYQGQGNRHKAKLLLMLMRTQIGCEFTAGGLAKMNRETIISVFQLCMSVLAFMKTINSK